MKFIRAFLLQGATASFFLHQTYRVNWNELFEYAMAQLPMRSGFLFFHFSILFGYFLIRHEEVYHKTYQTLTSSFAETVLWLHRDKRCGSFIEFVFITFTIFYYGNVCIYNITSTHSIVNRLLVHEHQIYCFISV